MIRVGVVGATGYTGIELVRILAGHPQVELTMATSRSYVGQSLGELFPSLHSVTQLICSDLDVEELIAKCDVIFLALPHGHSVPVTEPLLKAGKKVVDLGADFRLKSQEVYHQWYQSEAPSGELLTQAVYGLPELHRTAISKAQLIANPGCYPTSAILALAPAVEQGIIDLETIIIDAKSGVSGAGRSLSLGAHYAEVNDSFRAYKVASHRHTPEIEQELSRLADRDIILSFTPHLVPMNRGILATIYGKLTGEITDQELFQLYNNYYADEPFVRLLTKQLPQTNWVAGTNNCHLWTTIDRRTNRLVVVSAIDNLIKGAAGQGVQNMNIMCGLPETMGLEMASRYL